MNELMSPARALVRAVAQKYTESPDFWTQYETVWGISPDGTRYVKRCCIDIALTIMRPRFGGLHVLHEARALIYQQLGREPRLSSIHGYNDEKGRTVKDVINTLLGAATIGTASAALKKAA